MSNKKTYIIQSDVVDVGPFTSTEAEAMRKLKKFSKAAPGDQFNLYETARKNSHNPIRWIATEKTEVTTEMFAKRLNDACGRNWFYGA